MRNMARIYANQQRRMQIHLWLCLLGTLQSPLMVGLLSHMHWVWVIQAGILPICILVSLYTLAQGLHVPHWLQFLAVNGMAIDVIMLLVTIAMLGAW